MPKIGEVFWAASVKGVGEASDAADELSGSMDGVAESAIGAAAAQGTFGDETQDAANATDRAENQTDALDGKLGILSGTLLWAARSAGVAGTAMSLYSGATSVAAAASTAATFASGALSTALYGVAGAASSAWAAIAGPAGLAVGLVIATAGVGLLASELLGLTDVSKKVEKSNNRMVRTFADMAFLIAGPLAGFLIAGFHLITGNWEKAKRTFINTSVEWAKAAARFATRVHTGLAAFAIAVKTGIAATVEAADYAWRKGWNGILTFSQKIINQIANSIIGGIEGAINSAADGINGLIKKVNKIPKVNISPIGNVSLGGRNPLNVGAGTVQNEGLNSRLQRVSRRGNRQLRQVARRGRKQLQRFRPDTISGDRYTRGAKHMAKDEQTQIREQNVTVNVDGSNMDLSNMSRSKRKKLARMIGNEVGSSVGDTAGGK